MRVIAGEEFRLPSRDCVQKEMWLCRVTKTGTKREKEGERNVLVFGAGGRSDVGTTLPDYMYIHIVQVSWIVSEFNINLHC